MVAETQPELNINEVSLQNTPEDGITSVRFSPYSKNHLLVSSWDNNLRYYDTSSNKLDCIFDLKAPILDCDPIDQSTFGAASLDQNVYICYLRDGSFRRLGAHDNGVRCVRYCKDISFYDALITGSWDYTVRGWDMRDHSCTFTLSQENKVYAMAISDSTLVVGTSQRKLLIWDLRNTRNPVKRESSLKYQTRNIECFPSKEGFVISSIEGRVAVEFFALEDQNKKYAFKCHRTTDNNGIEVIYPVNGLSFHPSHGTFATGGSDGLVSVWDPFNKKRICQLHRFSSSVSSLSFSIDGSMLAIGISYLYEENEKEPSDNSIIIRHLTEAETRQRPS